MKKILLFNVLLVQVCILFGQKVGLTLHLEEGEKFQYQTVIDQDILTAVMGMEQMLDQKITMVYEYEVNKVHGNGDMDLDITYTRVAISQSGDMLNKSFDSDVDDIENVDESLIGYAGLVGKSFQMRMTPLGEVAEIKGVDEIYEDIFEQVKSGQKEQMLASIKSQYGDEALQEQMGVATGFYTKKPMKVGKSWKAKHTVNRGIGMIINTVYTLDKVEDNVAYISFESEVEPNENAPGLDLQQFTLKYELTGAQNGMIKVNLKNGWAKYNKTTQDLGGKMDMGIAKGDISMKGDVISNVVDSK